MCQLPFEGVTNLTVDRQERKQSITAAIFLSERPGLKKNGSTRVFCEE